MNTKTNFDSTLSLSCSLFLSCSFYIYIYIFLSFEDEMAKKRREKWTLQEKLLLFRRTEPSLTRLLNLTGGDLEGLSMPTIVRSTIDLRVKLLASGIASPFLEATYTRYLCGGSVRDRSIAGSITIDADFSIRSVHFISIVFSSSIVPFDAMQNRLDSIKN